MSKNPQFPYDNYDECSLDNFSEEECTAEFCVEKNDLPCCLNEAGDVRRDEGYDFVRTNNFLDA